MRIVLLFTLLILPGIQYSQNGFDFSQAEGYEQLADSYLTEEDYEAASVFLKKAIRLYEEGNLEEHYFACLSKLSEALRESGDITGAKKAAKKALWGSVKTWTENHPIAAKASHALALIYETSAQYDKALTYHQKGLTIHRRLYGNKHPEVAGSLRLIGQYYFNLGKIEDAARIQEELLSFPYELAFPEGKRNWINLPGIFHQKGLTAFEQQINDEALIHFQEAIKKNVKGFDPGDDLYANPKLNCYLDPFQLLESLHMKGETLVSLGNQVNDPKFMKAALATFSICDSLIDKLRFSVAFNDCQQFTNTSLASYTSGVLACLELYQSDNDTDHLEKAYYFMEKAKWTQWLNCSMPAIKDLLTLPPDTLLNREKEIDKQIFLHPTKVALAKYADKQKELKALTQEHQQLEEERNLLKQEFRDNFPEYYRFKYENTPLSIKKMQESILSPNTAYISYLLDDRRGIWFLMTREMLRFDTLSNVKGIIQGSKRFKNLIIKYPQLSVAGKDSISFHQYCQTASDLYNNLLAPQIEHLPKTIERLLIGTDQYLRDIPFGAFIRELPEEVDNYDYRHLDYFFKHYLICRTLSKADLFPNGPGADTSFIHKTIPAYLTTSGWTNLWEPASFNGASFHHFSQDIFGEKENPVVSLQQAKEQYLSVSQAPLESFHPHYWAGVVYIGNWRFPAAESDMAFLWMGSLLLAFVVFILYILFRRKQKKWLQSGKSINNFLRKSPQHS